MTLKLYDLCGAEADVRFSPPCWMAKLALLHKGLDFETVPLRFAEKANYPDPDYGMLPMLDDGGTLIKDSQAIAAHLDEKHPERPLFGSEGERAAHQFYRAFAGGHLFPALAPMTFADVEKALDDDSKAYFREKREARLGRTLEEAAADEGLGPKAEAALQVIAAPLEAHDFFGGSAPNLSDYLFGGIFLWRRAVAAKDPYETPPALARWFARVLDLYDGYGRKAKRAVA